MNYLLGTLPKHYEQVASPEAALAVAQRVQQLKSNLGKPLSFEEMKNEAELREKKGEAEEALSRATEHLQIASDLGRSEVAVALARVANVLAHLGRTGGAARTLSCAEALTEQIEAAEP